jgi:two-component system OmpR family response regulator
MHLDLESHDVTRRGRTVRLSPLEFRILHLLAANEGRVVSLDRLVEYAWNYEGGPVAQLKFHICHIRRKLQLEPGASPRIESVPCVGYKLTRPTRAHAAGADRPRRATGAGSRAPHEPVPAAASA